MRIALVTSSYPQSSDDPSGHFVRTEAYNLAQQGHHVTVICPGDPAGSMSSHNLSVLRLGAQRLFGWPGALARLRANPFSFAQLVPFVVKARVALRHEAFDRIIAHWLVPCGWPISAGFNAPIEVVVHGSDARLVAALPQPLRVWLLSRLQQQGCTLRFVAAHLKPLLTTHNNGPWISSSVVAPCAIDVDNVPDKATARATLALAPGAFVALVVGRLVPSKRVAVALERAPLPPDAQVVVLGSGPLRQTLSQRFSEVTFLGQLPRPVALLWLRAADVLLTASLSEGAPTVVREARALNTLVWTAPLAELIEWATHDPGICVLPELG